jgi:hypothetical protein
MSMPLINIFMKNNVLVFISMSITSFGYSQSTKFKLSISGAIGSTYEHYGLSVNPATPSFYSPRRPYNQVRFNIAPILNFGKNLSIPLNFNFATRATNTIGTFGSLPTIRPMSLKQFITNPLNNFSINPKYKWAELQLGTQYLNYTELTTGDIGIFGVGVDLKPPKNNVLKFFTGQSQAAINPGPPTFLGAYSRNHWMLQLGKEKAGGYKALLTMAKGKDVTNSTTPFPLPPLPPVNQLPQESFVLSTTLGKQFKKGYYTEAEIAQGLFTTNTTVGGSPPGGVSSFKPFITANAATMKDYAANFSAGKKSKHFDWGVKGKFLGAGYKTMGFPYLQPDRLDVVGNTRFDAWKDKTGTHKMNVVAMVGNRINNFSGSSGVRANQLIANINWFTQFTDKFSLNVGYNNFGFNANGLALGTPSIKNVSNDFSVNPTYIWTTKTMSNVVTFNYSYSKYKETFIDPISGMVTTTNNNTHTAMLSYVPSFFEKKLAPDFSALYFLNQLPGFKMQLFTVSSGISAPFYKNKIKWKGQVQYTIGKNNTFIPNNNLILTTSADIAFTKKLNWKTFITSNLFQYGNELVGPPVLMGANYLESFIRTGIVYNWR